MEQIRMEMENRGAEMTANKSGNAIKEEYVQRINAMPEEDRAFMEGFLYAVVTRQEKKGA